SALAGGERDTATGVLILSCFAVWGALAGGGPFAPATPHDPFLLLAFMISLSVVSLVLRAHIPGRPRPEVQMRLQEQVLRAMFGQSTVGIAQIDPSGRFILANNRFCGMVRRSAPELLRLRIQDLIDSDDLPQLASPMRQAIQAAEGFALEARHV